MWRSSPSYYLYGSGYLENEFSTINIPDKCGHIRCEQNVELLYLKFVTETGIFKWYPTDGEHALIYSNITDVIVKIINCIFTTGNTYNYESALSPSKIIRIFNGAGLIMDGVIIANFSINFDRMADNSINTTSPIVLGTGGERLTHVSFINVDMYNMKIPVNNLLYGICTGSAVVVNFESSTFKEIRGVVRSFWRRYAVVFVG
jgi:hypothetical protein